MEVIGFILMTFGVIFIIASERDFIPKLIGMALLLCAGAIFGNISHEPTAIDVYRGKTTLQITYSDSIPIDTVVVFKKQFHE